MISRREFLQVGMAASAMFGTTGFGESGRLLAQQSVTQDQLLQFLLPAVLVENFLHQ